MESYFELMQRVIDGDTYTLITYNYEVDGNEFYDNVVLVTPEGVVFGNDKISEMKSIIEGEGLDGMWYEKDKFISSMNYQLDKIDG